MLEVYCLLHVRCMTTILIVGDMVKCVCVICLLVPWGTGTESRNSICMFFSSSYWQYIAMRCIIPLKWAALPLFAKFYSNANNTYNNKITKQNHRIQIYNRA